MLALGRALMASPRMMLLDEPSLGLAPMLVESIFGIVERINREEGTTILLVEQNARVALSVADYGYIMEGGRVVLEGTAEELRANEDVKEFYLGLGDGGRRSYRDVEALPAAEEVAFVRGAPSCHDPGREAVEDWHAVQDGLAARAVSCGAEHSREIGRRLARAGVSVGDVTGVADLQAIPVLAKDDLPALPGGRPALRGDARGAGRVARAHLPLARGRSTTRRGTARTSGVSVRPCGVGRLPPRRCGAEQLLLPPDAGRSDARRGTARGGVRGDPRGRGRDRRPD